jgi:hypothetical protein
LDARDREVLDVGELTEEDLEAIRNAKVPDDALGFDDEDVEEERGEKDEHV